MSWQAPDYVSQQDCIAASEEVLGRTDIPFTESEDIIRHKAVGLDWDFGVRVYEPKDPAKIPTGADGRKIGVFLVHGGFRDWRSMERMGRLLAGKFGIKALAMTCPGRLYLLDPSRDWPGDTVNPDGTVRTPIWLKEEIIGPDQYDVIRDQQQRHIYGTRTFARAKPGTPFYDRMAGWPVAMEEGIKESVARHFPAAQFSVYAHGHSAGGPISCLMAQRVPNVVGVLSMENSPFGYINKQKHVWSGGHGKVMDYKKVETKYKERTDAFNQLWLGTWRDRAWAMGPRYLGEEGPNALMRLPWVMEEVLEFWDKTKTFPNFKIEYLIGNAINDSLVSAAQATAKRLKMNKDETEALERRYVDYTRELRGDEGPRVPPFLFSVSRNSFTHNIDAYREVIVPMFKQMDPAPRTALIHFDAGGHSYMNAMPELPMGLGPAVAKTWHAAITGGFFMQN
jgi:hypothetical protein